MEIVWDEPKRQSNIGKHALDFAALDESFFTTAVIFRGKVGRWVAVNRVGTRLVAAIFTRYGTEAVSVVSLRPASHTERLFYEQEKAKRV